LKAVDPTTAHNAVMTELFENKTPKNRSRYTLYIESGISV